MNLGPRPSSCLVPGGIFDLVHRLWKVRFFICVKYEWLVLFFNAFSMLAQ